MKIHFKNLNKIVNNLIQLLNQIQNLFMFLYFVLKKKLSTFIK